MRRRIKHTALLLPCASLLFSTCVAIEPGAPTDPLEVPDSNEEKMEEQQEEVREESNL